MRMLGGPCLIDRGLWTNCNEKKVKVLQTLQKFGFWNRTPDMGRHSFGPRSRLVKGRSGTVIP